MMTTIREALPEDFNFVVESQMAMALETEGISLDKEILESGVKAVIQDSSKARYFIAQIDGAPAGMLMITFEWSDWRDGWVWWIQSVYIKPGYRQSGVFKEMYFFLKKIVQDSPDLKGLRLYVDKRNLRAQKVYDSLGMDGDHYSTFEWMK